MCSIKKTKKMAVSIAVILITMIASLAANDARAEECFIAAPYVVQATHESAKVVWVTPAGTDAGTVQLEAVNGGKKQTVIAQLTTPHFHDSRLEDGDLDHLRHLALLENLEPFTKYNYEVQCGDGETTSTGRFVTAPMPDDTVPFEFVAVADAHNISRYLRISEPVGKIEPAFVIEAGDLIGGNGRDWSRWEAYFEIARPYLETSVLLPVVGGHDVRPARNFRSLFAFNDPAGDPVDENTTATYYSHRFGNLEVFVIDYTTDRDEQLIWLESALAASDAEWKILSAHNIRAATGGIGMIFSDGFYYELANLCEKYGVDIAIGGHYHIYERLLPIGSPGSKPVHFVTINSNGNMRSVRPSPITAGGIGQREHVFAHFRVNENHLEMEVINYEGIVIDRMNLIKDDDGMYQDEIMKQAVDIDLAIKLAHIYNGLSLYNVLEMRYQRSDIIGTFKTPSINTEQPAVLTLNTGYSGTHERDLSRFPVGSELIIYEQDDPSGWRTEYQVIEITGNTAEIDVFVPDGLVYDEEDGFNIPIKLDMNLRLDGREFERVTVYPTIVDEDDWEVVSSDEQEELPESYKLFQNYPNPFNPSSVIQYEVPEQTHVTLKVYDVIGQLVATLVNEVKTPGNHEVIFNASGFSSGIYLYRMQTDSFVQSRTMLLVR